MENNKITTLPLFSSPDSVFFASCVSPHLGTLPARHGWLFLRLCRTSTHRVEEIGISPALSARSPVFKDWKRWSWVMTWLLSPLMGQCLWLPSLHNNTPKSFDLRHVHGSLLCLDLGKHLGKLNPFLLLLIELLQVGNNSKSTRIHPNTVGGHQWFCAKPWTSGHLRQYDSRTRDASLCNHGFNFKSVLQQKKQKLNLG